MEKLSSGGITGARRLGTLVASAALGVAALDAMAISQGGEQKDMRRVGHADLQGRAAYHPDFIVYPDGRVIAFVGTHSNTSDNGPRPNPLRLGSPVEPNGTMIVDITDPGSPVERFHIPGPIASGAAQTQSNRLCLGSDLPGGVPGKVYMLRNVQTGNLAVSGYEVFDVTDVSAPVLVSAIRNLRNTHKPWWECKTGIAYLPGSKGAPAPQWRVGQRGLEEPPRGAHLPAHSRAGRRPAERPAVRAELPAHPPRRDLDARSPEPQRAARARRGARRGDRQPHLHRLGRGRLRPDAGARPSKTLPAPHGGWSGNPDDPSDAQLESAQASIL